MCVREDTCVKKAGLFGAKEPFLIPEERVKCLKCLSGLVVEHLSIYDSGVFEQLLLGSKTELARHCESNEGIVGGREDVEWLGDGREVVGEVDVVKLEIPLEMLDLIGRVLVLTHALRIRWSRSDRYASYRRSPDSSMAVSLLFIVHRCSLPDGTGCTGLRVSGCVGRRNGSAPLGDA
jgi:hypothetical protein